MTALLALQAAVSLALMTCQHVIHAEITARLDLKRMQERLGKSVSKLAGFQSSIDKMSVRGNHAAKCLAEMMRSATRVHECTREFISQQEVHEAAKPQ